MPRITRSLGMSRVYATMLETLLPRLEILLCVWLVRLEAKVALDEVRDGAAAEEVFGRTKKLPRAVKTDLDAGKPSVILLGARLSSNRQFCQTLIRRAASLLRDGRSNRCLPDRRRMSRAGAGI